MAGSIAIMDGNEAAASVAYRLSEVIAIYPITPSSAMGELSDEWAVHGRANVWGTVPTVIEMQSEGGAAGAVHGALQAGSLTTTFTASQGLLLMIPNMYKIAGELTSFVMHVSARAIATHSLSIFGDHSDVMACRQTGFAMLASASPQEAHDLALVAHVATLDSRIPFLHFFDGFRTSHELSRVATVDDATLGGMISEEAIAAHHARALSPEHPVIRGTASNPDVFFQSREACNPWYDACPGHVERAMDRLAALTGRRYRLFDYVGHPEAERVIVVMGSGAEAVHETVDWLVARGERVGLLKVRLYRPFSAAAFLSALPSTTRAIAVLDRTKEPGALGDPLYLDVITALAEARAEGSSPFSRDPAVVAGRFGLASKEFTPAHVRAVFDNLAADRPRNHFTVGIVDDVTRRSLPVDPGFDIEPDDVVRALFYGLGADGTVGANKNSIKIIGEDGDTWAQGYFVYDSKKSGAITISHLRFGPRPIRSTYLIRSASFIACHQWSFLDRYEMLDAARDGATFLLNAPYPPEEVWDRLPLEVQRTLIDKRIRLFVIDALRVARDTGMKQRINTVMQTCFFAISGIMPRDAAIAKIKDSVVKTYSKKGPEVVQKNFDAIDTTLAHLHEVPLPASVSARASRPPVVPAEAPPFVQRVTAAIIANRGDSLPVSAFPPDGTWPVATARWEKRNIAVEIPLWDPSLCIQCNKCAMVCPHAAIRMKTWDPSRAADAPPGFRSMPYRGPEFPGHNYTVQVAPEDCTGCQLCAQVCPAKDKSNPRHKSLDMVPQEPLRDQEARAWAFFEKLPEPDRLSTKTDVKGVQFYEPLLEFSGACSGCGETPYIKLVTQLFGDHTVIANATGCSSIYGANLPTTPYTVNCDGRGPAWANSLFEDNAEFGLGIRVALDQQARQARELLVSLRAEIGDPLVDELLAGDRTDEASIQAQRKRISALREKLATSPSPNARRLDRFADALLHRSLWIIGGDGWAYDIGFGGLDHVIASGHKVNLLVLDTEVYSNTGGQASKSTPLGASAKFAVAGKAVPKKDLALMAMTYGSVYVARVAMGAKDIQTVRALQEAESFPGPALIIAYSHCIAHGYDMAYGLEQQKLAVQTGYWPLFRFDPRAIDAGEPPLKLDSPIPKGDLGTYSRNETRFRMVEQANPDRFRALLAEAQKNVHARYALYEHLSKMTWPAPTQAGH